MKVVRRNVDLTELPKILTGTELGDEINQHIDKLRISASGKDVSDPVKSCRSMYCTSKMHYFVNFRDFLFTFTN